MGKAKLIQSGGGINIKNGIVQEAKSINGDIPPGMFIQEEVNMQNLSSANEDDMTQLNDGIMGQLYCEVPNSNVILLARQDSYNGSAYSGRNIDIVHVSTNGDTVLLGTYNVQDQNETDDTYKLGHIQGMFIIDDYVAVYGNSYSDNRYIAIIVFKVDISSDYIHATLLPINKTELAIYNVSNISTIYRLRNFRLCLNREDSRTMFGCMNVYSSSGSIQRDCPLALKFNEDYSVSTLFETSESIPDTDYYVRSVDYYTILSIDNSWILVTRQDTASSGHYRFKFTRVTLDVPSETVIYDNNYYEFSDRDSNKNQSVSTFTGGTGMKIVFNSEYDTMYLLGYRVQSETGTVSSLSYPSISKYTIKAGGKIQLEMWSLCQTYETSNQMYDIRYMILLKPDILVYNVKPTQYSSTSGFTSMRVKIMVMRPNGTINVYPSISNNIAGYEIRQYRSSSNTSYYSSINLIKTSFSDVLLYAYQQGASTAGLSKAVDVILAIKRSTTAVDGVTKTKCTADVAGEYWIPSFNQSEAFAVVEAYNSEITDRAINTIKATVISEMEAELNANTESEIVD